MINEKTLTVSMKRIDLCNLMLACTNTAQRLEAEGHTARKWRTLHDQLKAALDRFDADQAQQEAPAAEAEQLPTETENAPQAATQAAKGTTTDEQKEDDTMITTAFTPAEAAIHEATARGIIRRKGGYRERDIINHPHTVERGTWTTEHKVVEILATTPDPDGYRAGCAVDIVTRSIVG